MGNKKRTPKDPLYPHMYVREINTALFPLAHRPREG